MIATNLPSARVVLVGRDAEVDALAEQLLSVPGRLVTVKGCGGAGKTSVAIAVAREVLAQFDGLGVLQQIGAIPVPA